MRVNKAKLRAYLDNELSEQERKVVEKYLANTLEARITLTRLCQEIEQVNQALDILAPTSSTISPAAQALKRLQIHLKI